MKKRLLMPSRASALVAAVLCLQLVCALPGGVMDGAVGVVGVAGEGCQAQGPSRNLLLNGKSYPTKVRLIRGGSLPPVKRRRMNWIDAPDDVFYMGPGRGVRRKPPERVGTGESGDPHLTPSCPQHDGQPYCHKPCYGILFGPKGVNIGGAGSYIYEKPAVEGPQVTGPIEVPVARAEERKASGPPKGPSKASSVTTFTGEPNMCPRCNKRVYFAERVTSLGKDWHRPCLKCEKCGKTLTSGGHAEHEGKPYCNHPCYAAMFGPKGFGRGGAESHTFK
ncbi:PREDICTED: cysteine-rich protein 2 [Myotis davidii]|uniref:cysteine-rich protein 2 n=1 Tax=Myotis davidii TaxID=225400 RepID=UPI000767A46F|nr:PREDICTED: cysteine-rich protein 2 [Myotis davidii]